MNSVDEHKAQAEPIIVRVMILTISDTRSLADDRSGDLLAEKLEEAGCDIVERTIVPDDQEHIVEALRKAVADDTIDALISTGGTGFAPRDVTPEAFAEVIEKPMPGFGEIFRYETYANQSLGAAAMLSRTTAGTAGRTFLAALPGSPNAVRLGCTRLLVPELRHIVQQLRKA